MQEWHEKQVDLAFSNIHSFHEFWLDIEIELRHQQI